MYHSFLIHSSADGHLGCFHVLAIINSVLMDRVRKTGLLYLENKMGLYCILHMKMNFKYVLFNGRVIFCCVYVPQLSYPFVCRWTSGCFHVLACKQCCDEYWDICVSFNSGFLGVYAQQWDCMAVLFPVF